ncbi:hypothetical protein MRX96_029453 [Rhipicephalus microplus]
MWNDVRRGLPRKKRDPPKGGLLLLGDAVVEERQQNVLRLGPKFCVEPRLDLVDKLSLTRDIARQVPEKEKRQMCSGMCGRCRQSFGKHHALP